MSVYSKKLKDRHFVKHYSTGDEFSVYGLKAVDLYKSKFTLSVNANYKPYYPRNEQRYLNIVENFKKYFGDEVLDVGSRSKILSEKLGRPCSLVDKNNPDLPEFDWEKDRLPYKDNSFDSVVCLDTLEHVDNLHDDFYDLLRVSRKYIFISLPNPWRRALIEFIHGRGRWQQYGIPPEKPVDRHKWFFNTEDAEDFVYYNSISGKGNYTVREVQYHMPKTIVRLKVMYPVLRLILPEYYFKNLFVETIFFVLEKN